MASNGVSDADVRGVEINRAQVSSLEKTVRLTPGGQLGVIQALRAIAAVMVVLFHMNVHTLPNVLGSDPIWQGLNMGYAGVEIFFVLSGFIMFYIHFNDFSHPERLGSYLWKRITRIYPFFWIVLAGVIGLRVASGDPWPDAWSAFVSATLLPLQDAHILRVQWTLSYEMMFYFVFSLAILNKRLGLVIGALWFGSCAVVAVTGYTGRWSEFFLSAYNLLFLMGILAAFLWNKVSRGHGMILSIGIVLFIGVGLLESLGGYAYYKPLRTVLYGLGATAIVLALVALENLGRIRTPKWLIFLGDTSYALYLVHITAMAIGAKILLLLGLSGLPPIVLSVVLLGAAFIGGTVAHLTCEKPLIAFIRRRSHYSRLDRAAN